MSLRWAADTTPAIQPFHTSDSWRDLVCHATTFASALERGGGCPGLHMGVVCLVSGCERTHNHGLKVRYFVTSKVLAPYFSCDYVLGPGSWDILVSIYLLLPRRKCSCAEDMQQISLQAFELGLLQYIPGIPVYLIQVICTGVSSTLEGSKLPRHNLSTGGVESISAYSSGCPSSAAIFYCFQPSPLPRLRGTLFAWLEAAFICR